MCRKRADAALPRCFKISGCTSPRTQHPGQCNANFQRGAATHPRAAAPRLVPLRSVYEPGERGPGCNLGVQQSSTEQTHTNGCVYCLRRLPPETKSPGGTLTWMCLPLWPQCVICAKLPQTQTLRYSADCPILTLQQTALLPTHEMLSFEPD